MPTTQTMCIDELAEIIIVSEDKDLKFAAFQVVGPTLKSFNNDQEFLVMNFIPSLCCNYLSGEKNYGVQLTRITGLLAKKSTYNEVGSIDFHSNIMIWIKILKDWSFDKDLFQQSKS